MHATVKSRWFAQLCRITVRKSLKLKIYSINQFADRGEFDCHRQWPISDMPHIGDFIRQSQRPENSRHSFYQSGTKIKPLGPSRFPALQGVWLVLLWVLIFKAFAFHLICRCDYFVFVLRYFVEKRYVL